MCETTQKQPRLEKTWMDPRFYHLQTMTGSALARAIELCRLGRKDEARDWCRFFEQSNMLALLASFQVDVEKLSEQMRTLKDECHPDSHPHLKTEIEEIRSTLEDLKNQLAAESANREPVIPWRANNKRN